MLEIPHRVIPADIDERAISGATPREYALKTAFMKAGALDSQLPGGTIVLAADTIVVLEDEVLHKPLDAADACNILAKISGKAHQVITALAVREVGRATELDAVATDVKIRQVTQQQIRDYVATGEPMDKAGAYGIQGMGGKLVEQVLGDYFTVVGLPIDRMLLMLAHHIDTSPYTAARRRLTPQRFAEAQSAIQ